MSKKNKNQEKKDKKQKYYFNNKQVNDLLDKTEETMKNVNIGLKDKIRLVVENNDNPAGKLFDWIIQIFIIVSIVIYTVSTLPNLTPQWKKILHITDIVIYVVFTLEYFSRIYISSHRLKYIFSFYGLIDFIAILPFLFGTRFDLKAIRALRIFRIISGLKISIYKEAMERFQLALKIILPEVVLFFIVSIVFVFLAAAGIYYFEKDAQPDKFDSVVASLWWAIVTMTTVGYGDVYPITVGGRIFTFIMLLIGLGIVAIPSGLIASALSKAREYDKESLKELAHIQAGFVDIEKLEEMKNGHKNDEKDIKSKESEKKNIDIESNKLDKT